MIDLHESNTKPNWAEIRLVWCAGLTSPTEIATHYSVSRSTLYSRVRRKNWGKFGAEAESPYILNALALMRAQAIYQACDFALRHSLEALYTAPDDGKIARERAELIKAHRKALQTLTDALPLPECSVSAKTGQYHQDKQNEKETTHFATLDLAAARCEIMGRLDRLQSEATTSLSKGT